MRKKAILHNKMATSDGLCFPHCIGVALANMTTIRLRGEGVEGVMAAATGFCRKRIALWRCGMYLMRNADRIGKTDCGTTVTPRTAGRIPLQRRLSELKRVFRAGSGAGAAGHTPG